MYLHLVQRCQKQSAAYILPAELLYLACLVTSEPLEVERHGLLQNSGPFGPAGHSHQWQAWLSTAVPRYLPLTNCHCWASPDAREPQIQLKASGQFDTPNLICISIAS